MLHTFRASWNSRHPQPLPSGITDALSMHLPYFAALDMPNRKRFEARLYALLREITIIPEDIPEITPEMQALIGGGIIQLTFGLKYFVFTILNTIHIVPRPYAYLNKDQLMVGDMNLETQRVSFSWPDVKKGFDVKDDARNVVFHEFAHCLDYENSQRRFQHFFNPRIKKAWDREAREEMANIKKTDNPILRKYGATNIREMFSVCVEHFFERPEEFKAALPRLFHYTSILLNQDPLKPQAPVLNK